MPLRRWAGSMPRGKEKARSRGRTISFATHLSTGGKILFRSRAYSTRDVPTEQARSEAVKGAFSAAVAAVYDRQPLNHRFPAVIDQRYSRGLPPSRKCPDFSTSRTRKRFPFCDILAFLDNRFIIINILASGRGRPNLVICFHTHSGIYLQTKYIVS